LLSHHDSENSFLLHERRRVFAVSLLGGTGALQWKQNADALVITKPAIVPLLGIQRCTLDRHFRAVMAMSLNEFLVGERAEKARTLLRAAPPLSLREIARRCGFSDTQHMKKVLRRSGIARDFGRRPGRPAKAGAERSQGT